MKTHDAHASPRLFDLAPRATLGHHGLVPARPGGRRRARRAALRLLGRSAHARRVPTIRTAARRERVLAGVADLGVPTILFGVGTGELLDLMSSAGSTRDRHRLARRPRRRTPASRGTTGAGQPRPDALPGRGRRRRHRRARGAGSSRRRRRSRLQPRTRCVALDRSGGTGSGGSRRARRGYGGRPMTIGVLVMAYGTPTTPQDVEAYYTRIRHGRPPIARATR